MTKNTESSQAPASPWAAFWRGLTRPSLLALVLTILATAAWMAAAISLVTPASLAHIHQGYLTTVPVDHYGEVTLLAHRVAHEEKAPFAVVVMGDSAIRAALTDPAVLEREILTVTGKPVPVHYLSAKGLTAVEMAGIMDLIGPRFRGIVVLQLGQLQLSQTRQQQLSMIRDSRLAISSAALDAEWKLLGGSPPARTGNYFLDHWKFFSVRLNAEACRRLWSGPVQGFHRHLYTGPPPTDQQWAAITAQAQRDLATYDQEMARNQAIVNRLIEQQRGRGPVIWVVMDGPCHPDMARVQPAGAVEKHRSNMKAWSQSVGFHYWNLDREAELESGDFYDFGHLRNPSAQDRYTMALARRLAALCSAAVAPPNDRATP